MRGDNFHEAECIGNKSENITQKTENKLIWSRLAEKSTILEIHAPFNLGLC